MIDGIISGYSGLFQLPLPYSRIYEFSPTRTLYVLSDENRDELAIIALAPGAYEDISKIAKNPMFKKIVILTPNIGIMFISDIYNAMKSILEMKPDARWIFPQASPINNNMTFENCKIIADIYINSSDANLTIEYIQNPELGTSVYDIKITDGTKVIYLCQYLTKALAENLLQNRSVTEVHIPYSNTLFGGLTYMDIIDMDPVYRSKFKPNSFTSISEYENFIRTSMITDRVVKYNKLI